LGVLGSVMAIDQAETAAFHRVFWPQDANAAPVVSP